MRNIASKTVMAINSKVELMCERPYVNFGVVRSRQSAMEFILEEDRARILWMKGGICGCLAGRVRVRNNSDRHDS